ncbi:lactonase family protein [Maribacter aurantiacus]|uniref:Lactonase family protein n=1 Tax=Maribacter aurantiacus TaxID=1882343 RepID=A0A5R8MA00_9FLAO|nr:lactonase family protein [Maribacter aurantiacus]TLF46347.1 lactonase family protein [Maribacter aurantiacus]
MNRWSTSMVCLGILFMGCKTNSEHMTYDLYVGTYTEGDSNGIYQLKFNANTGALTNKQLAATIENPSFIKFSPDNSILYSVLETDTFEDTSGGVIAYELLDGKLIEKGAMATVGAHPCHIAVSDDGHYLAASSYTGGNATIFSLDDIGGLKKNPQVIDLQSLDTLKSSHTHSAAFTKEGLFIADLGLDAVKRFSLKAGKFEPNNQPSIDLPNGAGPRHFTFGQDGKFLYTINELNSTITVFERNGSNYSEKETHTTLSHDFNGKSYCADIHLSPDGNFLYGSNRGEQTIVIFKVDQATGSLSLVGRESVHGDWPRNFTLDPTGKYLLVANQKSSNIVVFKRDLELGTLAFLEEIDLSNPVCLEFLD